MSITQEEMELWREEKERFMPDKGMILKPFIPHDDEYSGEDEEIVEDNVPCRIKAGLGFFRIIAQRMQVINAHIITIPYRYVDKVDTGWTFRNKSTGENFRIRDARTEGSYLTEVQMLGDRIE